MQSPNTGSPQSGLESKIYEAQVGFRAGISKALGIIIGVAGMGGAFLVSLLRSPEGELGLKEKASDPWFWVVWGVIFFIAMGVILTTYKITKKEAKDQEKFVGTMMHYKAQKDKAMENIDLLPFFCDDKNKDMFSMLEREIVESADMLYDKFKADGYRKPFTWWMWLWYKIIRKNPPNDKIYLEKWQVKKLKAIKEIKIEKLRSRDLTQEYSFDKNKSYSFLPQDEKTNEKSFMVSGAVNRALNTFAFLLVGSLGFSLIGWVSALTNAIGILFAWVGAIITANDYVNNTLRNRFISKADLLQEFNSTVDKYKHHRNVVKSPAQQEILAKDDKQVVLEIKTPQTGKNEGALILKEGL